MPQDHVLLTYTEWDAWDKYVCARVLLAVFLICTEGYVWDNCGEGKGEGVHGNREREEERERQRGGEMRAVLLTCTEGGCFGRPWLTSPAPLPMHGKHLLKIMAESVRGGRGGKRGREWQRQRGAVAGGLKGVRVGGRGCVCARAPPLAC